MEQRTTDHSHECFSVVDLLKSKLRTDGGFSGYLHAITGVVAVEVFFLVALLQGWGESYIGWASLALIFAFALAWIGATLYPDLDNSKSTSHSAFGFIGEAISVIFRVSSSFLQTVIRTPKDDASPNPHRGFYHTLISTVLVGAGIWGLTQLPQKFSLPIFGEVTLGWAFAVLFLAAMIHLFLSALAKSKMKKIQKGFFAGELIAFLVSLSIALLLMAFIPISGGYLWLGIAIAAGGATHILGDTFTRYGTPLFFPLTVFTKKRFWWYTRFGTIESGGSSEKIIVWVCIIVAILLLGPILGIALL